MKKDKLNILCISTYFKGVAFIKACKEDGNNVYLLTKKKLENEEWPWESIDETFYIDNWNTDHVISGIAYKFQTIQFDTFVALDDFDVEHVAALREHFRVGGMGQTTSRHFRDKLSMRQKALDSDIPVPSFVSLFNNDMINAFADQVPAPWLIKPRHEASATGITKIHSKDQLWEVIDGLGEDRHKYLVEKFEPGDVYHADSLTVDGEVVFCSVSKYLDTPFEVAHGGGIFRSQKISNNDEKAIVKLNTQLMKSFGLKSGAAHTEFIRSKVTGKFYFLETASRVGGANIAEMVEAASGINLWAEWAKIEIAALKNRPYKLPKVKKDFAGIVVSLSRYEAPDYSSFDYPEIVWRMKKSWHIGMIVTGDSEEKVSELLGTLTERIAKEFHASLPAPKKSL